MMKTRNLQIFLGVILFALTVILTSYSIKYTYSYFFLSESESILDNWNYIITSLQLTVMTLLAGSTAGQFKILENLNDKRKDPSTASIMTPFFIIMPLIILLYYPGIEHLGLESDKSLIRIIISITAIQTIFYYTMIKLISNELIKPINYIVLLLVSIAIIFIVPILPIDGSDRYIDY